MEETPFQIATRNIRRLDPNKENRQLQDPSQGLRGAALHHVGTIKWQRQCVILCNWKGFPSSLHVTGVFWFAGTLFSGSRRDAPRQVSSQ